MEDAICYRWQPHAKAWPGSLETSSGEAQEKEETRSGREMMLEAWFRPRPSPPHRCLTGEPGTLCEPGNIGLVERTGRQATDCSGSVRHSVAPTRPLLWKVDWLQLIAGLKREAHRLDGGVERRIARLVLRPSPPRLEGRVVSLGCR
jgi:hypothetical protein